MLKPIYLFSISSHPHAIGINSLEIKLLKPSLNFSQYDSIIITSKQAVEALKQYDKKSYIHMPSLCVSAQTALAYEEIGGRVLDIGSGYGDNLIEKIKGYPKEKKWLYLRAQVVASNFVCTCRNDGYSIEEAIVYKSGCSQEILDVKVEDNSVLIFTSPSSLNCFLNTHTISPHAKVVVIGKTTASALPKGVEYILSDSTTIESCIELGRSL
jgi:uroporphyrinogen-III synthase